MGTYHGPSCRQCRREGMKLFLKGSRCYMAKCPIDTGRPVPGMHGMNRRRKTSDYGTQLRAKQALRRHYGLREHQFRLFFKRVAKRKGVTGELLLQMLESRLDNLIYRMGFAPSRCGARQLVSHGHVKVDGAKATIASMIVKPGSVITITDKTKSRELATKSLEMAEGRELPEWLNVDPGAFSGEYVREPTRDEIAPVVDEQLVVELYSK